MSLRVTRILCAVSAICSCVLFVSGGAEVRLSFFQDTNTVSKTVEFLIGQGCSQRGTTVFEHAVHQYFKEPFNFDSSEFPPPTNGFYRFAPTHDLITAVTNRFPKSTESFPFNCADAVIALADERLRTTARPDDIVGPVLVVPNCVTNDGRAQLATTLREAFDWCYPSEARKITDSLFPPSMRDARTCLTPFLIQWQLIPQP